MRIADSIQIDTDEGRFVLLIDGEQGTYQFDIHAVALELEAEVRRELRPYAIEAEHARTTFVDPLDDGYEPTDPKHPMYHALVSELTDSSTIDRARRAAQDRRRPW